MGGSQVPSHGWEPPQTRDQLAEGDFHTFTFTLSLSHFQGVQSKLRYTSLSFQVVFNRDNILSLFEKFGVPKKFDLLSEDSDAYDFFLTEAILEVTK